jgi:hypothetical protein
LRKLFADVGEDVRQQIRRDRRDHADAERARERGAEPAPRFDQAIELDQQPLGEMRHLAARGRRQHALGVALEQLQSELRFELLQLFAQRRLRDVTACGGAAEVQTLGEFDQVLELADRGSHGRDSTLDDVACDVPRLVDDLEASSRSPDA